MADRIPHYIPCMALLSANVPYLSGPNDSRKRDLEEDQDLTPSEEWIEQVGELVNASALAAIILLREDINLLPMTESAVWILYCALEDELNDTFGIREAELYMPAATAVLTITGDKIYDMCFPELPALGCESFLSFELWTPHHAHVPKP